MGTCGSKPSRKQQTQRSQDDAKLPLTDGVFNEQKAKSAYFAAIGSSQAPSAGRRGSISQIRDEGTLAQALRNLGFAFDESLLPTVFEEFDQVDCETLGLQGWLSLCLRLLEEPDYLLESAASRVYHAHFTAAFEAHARHASEEKLVDGQVSSERLVLKTPQQLERAMWALGAAPDQGSAATKPGLSTTLFSHDRAEDLYDEICDECGEIDQTTFTRTCVRQRMLPNRTVEEIRNFGDPTPRWVV